MIEKSIRWRNVPYMAWVKSLPCAMCGCPSDDAHHIKGVGHMSGAGTKAPDWATMPLRRIHHDEMHRNPEMWPMQWEMISRTIGAAIESGMLGFRG